MSMVASLHEDDTCWCPACGEIVEDVSDDGEPSYDAVDGETEYYIECPYCGQSFYVSKAYYK